MSSNRLSDRLARGTKRALPGSRASRAALLLSLVCAGTAPGGAVSQEIRPQIAPGAVEVPRGDLFIQNLDAIWTAAGDVLQNSSILIRNGKIEAIGPNLSAPSGVQVIDGSGITAMPGIVDQHSHIAMASTNESTAPVVPEVRVIDALNPLDFGIFRALSGGRDHRPDPARKLEPDRGPECDHQDALGDGRLQEAARPGGAADGEVRPGRERDAQELRRLRAHAFPGLATGGRSDLRGRLRSRPGVPAGVGRLPGEPLIQPGPPPTRSSAGGAGGHHGGADPRPRARLPVG